MSSDLSSSYLTIPLEPFISRGKLNEESPGYIAQINETLAKELISAPEVIEFLKIQADIILAKTAFSAVNIVDKVPGKDVAAYSDIETQFALDLML